MKKKDAQGDESPPKPEEMLSRRKATQADCRLLRLPR